MNIYRLDRGRRYAIACTVELRTESDWVEVVRRTNGIKGIQAVFFNPRLAVGPVHVVTAADYATRAFRIKRNVAKSFHVETFLFAAITNEISRALQLFQPSFKECKLHAVIVGESPQRCENAIEILRKEANSSVKSMERSEEAALLALKELGISEQELRATRSSSLAEAVEKCLLSRMAMLFIYR